MDALKAELDAACQLRSSWRHLALRAAEKQQLASVGEQVPGHSMGSSSSNAAVGRQPSAVGAAQFGQHQASAASRAASLSSAHSRSSSPAGEPSIAESRRASGASSRASVQGASGLQRSGTSTLGLGRGGAQSRAAAVEVEEAGAA
jgi:hypothetical protein